MSVTFEGRKLVVVGGSSGVGEETAGDVEAGGGSVVVIGRTVWDVNGGVMAGRN